VIKQLEEDLNHAELEAKEVEARVCHSVLLAVIHVLRTCCVCVCGGGGGWWWWKACFVVVLLIFSLCMKWTEGLSAIWPGG
jgi:hypothetical protein